MKTCRFIKGRILTCDTCQISKQKAVFREMKHGLLNIYLKMLEIVAVSYAKTKHGKPKSISCDSCWLYA
jgi:hypothetical protein